MFIRKKKNKSGTTSIMLLTSERRPGKKHSNLRIIKNFGSSNNENELTALISQAEAYKAQLMLLSPKAVTLKIASGQDIQSFYFFNIGFLDVYGKFFRDVFENINLSPRYLKKLHDIVVMRIANPASKRKSAMTAKDYGLDFHVDSAYKMMDQLTDDIILQTKKVIYNHSTKLLREKSETVDVIFYDLTTIYFETNSQDSLRDFGFSKDGKHQHVQVMLAVIVTKRGLPIDYQEFPGNCYEGHTLIPVIEKLKEKYHIEKTILVADAALMNHINLDRLTQKNISYVISARIKNAKKDIKEIALNKSDYKIISRDKDDFIQSKIHSLSEKNTLILFHSTKRERKDAHAREKDIRHIKKYFDSTPKKKLTNRLKKTYVKISKGCEISIDLEKLEQEKKFDGLFAIQTNLEDPNPREILNTYRGLWQIEQTFRVAKTNLEIRPVYHYSTQRIKAHFLICYMSLALMRYVEFQLHENRLFYPLEQLHFFLEHMRAATLQHSDQNIYFLLADPPPQLVPVYQALHIPWRKRFTHEAAIVVPRAT